MAARSSPLPLRAARAPRPRRLAPARAGVRPRGKPDGGRAADARCCPAPASSPRSPSSLAALAFCFWPIAGRAADEWLPIAGRFTGRRVRGRHRHLSTAPQAGVRADDDGRPQPVVSLPAAAAGLELLAAPLRGEAVGVVKDRRARTYTAALAVRVTSFGLLDRAEQEARQAGWGGVLASLAREGSPVSRIQWVERTVPADGDEIGRYLGEAWDRGSRAARVAADAVVPRSRRARRRRSRRTTSSSSASRSTRSAPGARSSAPEERTARTPARAPSCFASSRRSASGSPQRTCTSSERFGPGCSRARSASPSTRGRGPGWRASRRPTAIATGSTRPPPGRSPRRRPGRRTGADGAVHATYWIASWPRTDVGAAFLSPLLLHAQMVRAIAVTIEPISPLRAIREVEASRTSDLADRELRGRMGFMETARRRRVAEATIAPRGGARRRARRRPLRRLRHRLRAQSDEELERHCSEVEHAAQMARLELLRLYGQQEEAFTYTLPLCRGLR